MGYDPFNGVPLMIWTSLTISLDGQPTANTIMLKMLDQIYTVSPLQQRRGECPPGSMRQLGFPPGGTLIGVGSFTVWPIARLCRLFT